VRSEFIGLITNFRKGPKSQRNRECLLKILYTEPSQAKKFIGWKVKWPHIDPKINGVISKTHGRTGTLRAKFKKGLPGQALCTKVILSRQ
jgi:large subunit ribosomal protein L35Ae